MEAAQGREDGRDAAHDAAGHQPEAEATPPAAFAGGEPLVASRPEIFVGAAFLGGLVAAKVLRLVRR
jgi:hypothetical protein